LSTADAARFLMLLDEGAERFHFRTFGDDKTQNRPNLTRNRSGRIEVLGDEFAAMNTAGAGVFVVVNEGGQTDAEITRIRAVFADTDGAPLEPITKCGLEPHVIIESSRGRWYVIWLVDGLPIEAFKAVQAEIARRFGTDQSVTNPSRVLRLPGFKNRKPERKAHLVKIIHESGALPYSAEKILATFLPDGVPASTSPTKHALVASVEHVPDDVKAELRDALQRVDAEDRDTWIKVAAALATADCGEELFLEYSARSPKHRPDADLATFRGLIGTSRSHWRAIFDLARAAGWKDPPAAPRPTPTITSAARERAPVEVVDDLPPHAEAFLNLPYGLGLLQQYVLNRARYPSRAIAGAVALTIAAHFTCRHIRVDAGGGPTSTAIYGLVTARTGFGKEDLRGAIDKLDERARANVSSDANLRMLRQPTIQYALPASEQALHAQLEANSAQTYLPDEVGDWIARTANDAHRQGAMSYLMQLFSRHSGKIAPPSSITRTYTPVQNPRVNILGTSTPERLLAVMSGAQAESGFYNRLVIFPAEQAPIPKRYEGFQIEPSADVIALVDSLLSLPEQVVSFDPGARIVYRQIDSAEAEPLRTRDPLLAARLGEQAIRIAGLIALSDRRTTVKATDVEVAFAIRFALYRRAATLVGTDGALSGMHATGKAAEQLSVAFRRHAFIARSHLASYSRAFKGLSTAERESVVRALLADGIARTDTGLAGRLVSLIHETS
jgi:hypothetical protein